MFALGFGFWSTHDCSLGQAGDECHGDWVRPIWPGFAINTVVYAIILWLLICGPFIVRRDYRVWRGRCPECGYDLRGDLAAGCPECGWNREEATT